VGHTPDRAVIDQRKGGAADCRPANVFRTAVEGSLKRLGPYTNEELVGRALKGRRDGVVVATKFGFVSHSGGGPGVLDSSPANIRHCRCE
jgi:aryl-alcohol dehydrogenase-like predicted oxidoreductase